MKEKFKFGDKVRWEGFLKENAIFICYKKYKRKNMRKNTLILRLKNDLENYPQGYSIITVSENTLKKKLGG